MSGGSPDGLFDPGAQPERTLLAWRRTTLALAVGSAGVVRFVTPALGPPAVVVGLLGVGLCGVAYAAASARYRHVSGRLAGALDGGGGTGLPASPGAACAALAGALVLVGLGALSFVVARALP